MESPQTLSINVDQPNPPSIESPLGAVGSPSTSSEASETHLISPKESPTASKNVPKQFSKSGRVLLSTNVNYFFAWILIPPLGALLASFLIGFSMDYDELVNYEWTCGKAFLPSISRIINLPKERIFWNLGSLSHLSLRPFLIIYHFKTCIGSATPRSAPFVSTLSWILLISGFCELFFTAILTVVGEREDGILHMAFFIGFISSCIIYFITVTISTRLQKNYSFNPTLQKCFKIRLILLFSTLVLVPSIGILFTLYWSYCIKFAYNGFAFLEYITVFIVFGFHSVIILELKHFQISIVCPQKTKE